MKARPIRRGTTRLVLLLGVLCLLIGLLQASLGLTGWPSTLEPAANLVASLLLLGIGATLVSFRRW